MLELVIDHRGKTPKKLGGDFVASGVPVVSAIHIKGRQIKWDERERFVTQEMFRKWMSVRLRKGDLLLTSEAPLGEVALVPSDDDLTLSQRLFALRGKPEALDTTFLMYFLASPEGQRRLHARASGTTVLGIRQSELMEVLIPLPPIEVQRRISRVLTSMDDLLENNRQLTVDLVDSADSIALRYRGDGELRTFGEVARVSGGGTPSTKNAEYWGGEVAWATPTDLTALASPYLLSTSRTITQEGLKACASSLFPKGTILMTSRATIGAFAIAEVPVAVNQGFIVVEPLADLDRYFLFHEMRRRVPEFIQRANGSTFLELSRGVFKELPITWPSEERRAQLAHALAPIHRSAAELQREVVEVREVRDELLPLLLSGLVAVSELAA